jgi:hypothetical protein
MDLSGGNKRKLQVAMAMLGIKIKNIKQPFDK